MEMVSRFVADRGHIFFPGVLERTKIGKLQKIMNIDLLRSTFFTFVCLVFDSVDFSHCFRIVYLSVQNKKAI